MSIYLSNAFSLQMQGDFFAETSPIDIGDVSKEAISIVGHADVASVLSDLLGYKVPVNRVSVSLQPGDVLFVGQYCGPRLPEGATKLPQGAKISWYRVDLYQRQQSKLLSKAVGALVNEGADVSEFEQITLDDLLKYQARFTGGFSTAYGGFRASADGTEIMFCADGGCGGGFDKDGPYPGEEGNFFDDCKTLHKAIRKAWQFCSTPEFEEACKTASFGDSLGELAAGQLSD
jgi:hypothetical protein